LKQVKALQIVIFYKMVDHNISIGETNKLEGSLNYQAWKIKAKAIYKRENSCQKNLASVVKIVGFIDN
jgi:hypothetical protein